MLEATLVSLLVLVRRWRRKSPAQTGSPRILVIRLDQLGDLILTLPLLTEIKRYIPGAQCTVVVQSPFVPLLTEESSVDEVIGRMAAPARCPAICRGIYSAYLTYKTHLRGRQFDLVLCPRYTSDLHQATILALLVKATRSMGYRSPWQFGPPYDVTLGWHGVKHEAQRSLDLLRELGHTPEAPIPWINTTEQDTQLAESVLAGQPEGVRLVALGLGSSDMPSKRWPPEYFARTLRIVGESVSVMPIVLCSPSEIGLAEEFGKAYGLPHLVVSTLNVRQASALLKLCHLFIGNDSGGAHLAAASGIPVVTMVPHSEEGPPEHPANPARFGPLAKRVSVVMPKKAVLPCVGTCTAQTAHCVLANAPETVAREALKLLAAEVIA